VEAKYFPKCELSRFMEVDCGGGQRTELDIPVTILRHLPFITKIQQLYMTKESAKQMTSHKNGKRYNSNKMLHAFDGEAWTHFDAFIMRKLKTLVMYMLHWPHCRWSVAELFVGAQTVRGMDLTVCGLTAGAAPLCVASDGPRHRLGCSTTV
jgi:hypothetical protein